MAVTLQTKKISVSMKLNNGTDSEGKIKLISANLGSLSTTNFDAQKAANIINALKPCLSKVVYTSEITEVKTILESA